MIEKVGKAAWISFLFLPMVLGFQNCSNQSSFEGLEPISVPVGDGISSGLNQFEGLRILNGEVYINCFEDHVQMGGVCNTGGAAQNFIRYWMTHNGAPVFWGPSTHLVDRLDASKCENGRWSAIVPRPNRSELNGVAGQEMYLEYEMYFQLYMRAPGSSDFQAGSRTPAYTINIQQISSACSY